MPTSITPVDSNVMQALGQFLTAIMPAGVEVIRGQENRVAPPDGDYVVMNPGRRNARWLPSQTWDQTDPNPTTVTVTAPTAPVVQCDFHGESAADNASILTSLMRTPWGVDQFKAMNLGVTPLSATDPVQAPFKTGEQQYEDRWTVDIELQINAVITVTQDFAATLEIGLVNVDAAYPPGG